jgi:hypothetical protein
MGVEGAALWAEPGMICLACGRKGNGAAGGASWHRCILCGTLYCPECAQKLRRPWLPGEERICQVCLGPTRAVEARSGRDFRSLKPSKDAG